MKKRGCVYLVGAGCGEADLITLRGLSLLRTCDVVIYDDLIAQELLEATPPGCERIYMGKRCGKHSAPQKEISETIVAKAKEGKMVVRLKGGDPFVFGRGGEEIMALQAAGIPYEEVPGISSAIAIPAAAGIPVTHRGASRSLHIITGHTADSHDGLPDCMDQLAALDGTLVFLMGLSQLERITKRLMEGGKAPETPAAVVSGGNARHPVTVRGTLADLSDKARDAGVQAPAVIVVGAVAALELSPTVEKPLKQVTVGLTGTTAVTEKLGRDLRTLGARTVLAERSVVEELPVHFEWRKLQDGRPHWVVFTSSNGVRIFFKHLREQQVDLRTLAACRFAVIGAATGETLLQYGLKADLCPDLYTSEGLARELCDLVKPEEDVLLFRSAKGSAVLIQALKERGIPCQDIPVYDLRASEETAAESRELLDSMDYLAFSSGSGVELYYKTQGEIPEGVTCVCIGEVTARALARRYDRPFLTAEEISAEGITRAILKHRGAVQPAGE